ncbi:TPA_asm: P3 [Silene gammacytorhabdovirus 1]|nr:TPA_asm: P3 [Silene gammacytorhabdovirus 1]
MFSTNFSVQVKQSIVIKKLKISGYGAKGEMKPSGTKTRFYRMFSSRKAKYLTITGLDLEWTPTAPHLLSGAFISIKMKDLRASDNSGMGDLLFLRKPADKKWTINMELSLSTPAGEMLDNPPLCFDIDIQSGSMKSGVEIGKLNIIATILSTSDVSGSVIKSAVYNTAKEEKNSEDCLVWKGMSNLTSVDKNTKMTKLVGDYLNGNMNMDSLSKMMCSVLA